MFEGRNLREQFCKEANIEYVYEHFNEEVSVLEVLIALAYRCESIMVDQDRNFPMRDWFWKMMENVGLIDYTDDEWSPFTVMEKVNIIIKRQYERNGKGGLFPLKRTKEDQRKVELWYQMNYYLVENYYNED
jgi:hypothetical protein